MELLYALEKIRVPILNEIMLAITTLGEETAFLVIAILFFWCIDKRRGYYLLSVGFVGIVVNQFLKLLCRVPRPWVKDPDFTILELARDAASGYSFPSGHTQTAVGAFGGIAATTKKTAVRWVCIIIAILVSFSRMYIGVHTPADVLTSLAIGVALIFVFRPILSDNHFKKFPYILSGMAILSGLFLCFVRFYPFPADLDMTNYASGFENAYTLIGATIGLITTYAIDEKWIKFPVQGVWWVQIMKVLIGLALVLAVKSGLKVPLNNLLGEYIGRAFRYFLLVITAGVVWPSTFAWFSTIGRKENS